MFENEVQYKKSLINTKANALSCLLNYGDAIQHINEDNLSYLFRAPQVRGIAMAKECVIEALEAHVLHHTFIWDHKETKDTATYNDDDLHKDADDMFEIFFTSENVLMYTSDMTDGAI